ncbi:hypothetical protein RI129_002684 [Pyrocoelia pectoralis]|uniref:CUB domain-containing protein n=1 Tax=Pyrocoelia pectoralis TaxID=417401 RepID=A0AAN7ZLQ6_9COLE
MSAYYHVIFSLVFSIIGHYIECAFFDYTDISDDLYQHWEKSTRLIEPNRACTATDDGQLDGVCKNIAECAWSRGISRRATACGFLSQCCIHRQSCNGRTAAKVSYFTNDLQTTPIQNCDYTVQLMNRNICQLRLDFISMYIDGPNAQGECVNGAFSVRGFPTIPRICGANIGQHMYVQISGGQVSSVVLNVQTQTQIVSPTWLIKVTQLHCPRTNVFNLGNQYRDMVQDFPLLAPLGCLQYYREPFGVFRTFGYTNNVDASRRYIRPLGYTICFRNQDPSQNRCMSFVCGSVGVPVDDDVNQFLNNINFEMYHECIGTLLLAGLPDEYRPIN